jgi:hypothetical protein
MHFLGTKLKSNVSKAMNIRPYSVGKRISLFIVRLKCNYNIHSKRMKSTEKNSGRGLLTASQVLNCYAAELTTSRILI